MSRTARTKARTSTAPSFASNHNPQSGMAPHALDDEQLDVQLLEVDATYIDDIPARDGYVQKWVRTRLNGEEDYRNLSKQQRLGWRPRPADTLPDGYAPPTTKTESLGNVIGVGDLILMEMPEARAQMIRDANLKKDQLQMQSVRQQQLKDTGGAVTGRHDSSASTREPTFDT